MPIYLDANAIVYLVEGIEPFHSSIIRRVIAIERDPDGVILTSRLSRLECRVKPTHDNNIALLDLYEEFFSRDRLSLVEITPRIIERATLIRAAYGFKTPDSIHLATAISTQCATMLTADKRLTRCAEISVELLKGS